MDDLKGLSDEELQTKADELSQKTQELSAEEKTSAAEFNTWVDELEAAVSDLESVNAELAARKEVAEKAEALKAKAAELAEAKAEAEAKVEEDKAEELSEEAEAEAEAEASDDKAEEESAAEEASVEKVEEVEISPENAEVPTSHAPVAKAEVEEPKAVLVASADIPGVATGSELGIDELANALIKRRKSIKNSGNDGEFVLVASAESTFEDDRILTGDWESDQAKIKAVAGVDTIIASGGVCAPSEPYYGLQVLSGAERPVKNALPSFGASRGSIRFMTPPRLADVMDSARVTTEAEDTAGYGESLTDPKPSVQVVCDDENLVVVDAVSSILTVGNLTARTFPEQVAAWTQLAAARHAQVAETNILDKIGAASTSVTSAKVYGASRSLLADVDRAVAGYRSRHRVSSGLNIRILLPEWVKNLLRVDILRQAPGDGMAHFAVSDAEIAAWFAARGVSVSYYKDTQTGAGQAYGAQNTGALADFPGTVVWYLFVEGSFLFLDGGQLDLGLVRDSTLNSTNDYSLFVETFENVAFVGIESLRITSTVEPDGSAPTGASITG